RRFYDDIVAKDASAASPLLFPETVYNAPASHLASILGVTGITYTLVGDATAGISAMKLGSMLLENNDADFCLLAAGEEIDWIVCEAYRQWRYLSARPEIRVFAKPPRGTI